MTWLSESPAPGARRVLVVDDDDVIRRELCTVLRGAGYVCEEAWGAMHAMRLILSWHPDAVLLDLVLPDGHGIEVGRAMRAIVTSERTCVVAMTSSAGSVTLVDPSSFGAETILVKPVSPEAVLVAIGRCFGHDPAVVAEPEPLPAPAAQA